MRSKIVARTVPMLAACVPLAAIAAAAEAPLPGVWQRHEYVLSYTGFTTSYTCDGIAQKVRLLLLAAGARDDLKVVGRCSSAIGGPSRIATAKASFSTLSPAPGTATPQPPADGKPGAVAEPGLGVWKAVELRERTPSWLEAGDCELVEHFDRELLPLFATRDRQSHMTCTLGEYALGAISLRFQTFVPLPTARTGRAATPQ